MEQPRFLTKTDFQIAEDCPTKLYYKKHHFPTSIDENEYMQMLADGGFMVAALAKLLYPDGIEVRGNTMDAIANTERLLSENATITLFEAAIAVNDQLARIDILVKNHNRYELIEVKSKSYNSQECDKATAAGKKYWERADFLPYLEDAAFQKKLLLERYPDVTVNGFLMMPNKAKTTRSDGMVGWFSIERSEGKDSQFDRPWVTFTGTEAQRLSLFEDNPLGLVNVDEWIDPMLVGISERAKTYRDSIREDRRIETPLSCRCQKCEYTVTDPEHPVSGMVTCWGDLAKPKPHILELAQLGNINRKKTGLVGRIDVLIGDGRAALADVPESYLVNEKGEPAYNGRPLYQRTGKAEILERGFFSDIAGIEYPLHFIDFETSQMALPYHRNMRPFGKVIFQWSCHTIEFAGAEPTHAGWLNVTSSFPNFEFARSLRDHIGERGTLLTWSSYENTQLRNIYDMLEEWGIDDDDLKRWLLGVVRFEKGESRIVDMEKLAKSYYFHPRMGGRTSIKVTLPAVLESFTSERISNWLRNDSLLQLGPQGKPIDPYTLLPEPTLIFDGKRITVKEGGGAMIAYQDMVYGLGRNNDEVKKLYAEGLERYCKLDTLAMVIIWEHWMSLK